MYVMHNQLDEAIKHFQTVLIHAPEDRDTLMALGKLYIQAEKDAEAARC